MKNVAKSTMCPPARWLLDRPTALSWRARWTFLFMPARCYFCGAESDLGCVDLCLACLEGLPWLDDGTTPSIRAAFTYSDPVDEALKGLKYGGDRRAARLFGALLAAVGSTDTPDVLVRIPLHPDRLCDRGFNQSLLIAREVGASLRRPVRHGWMMRIKATPSQTGLHAAERRRNVTGAFVVTPGIETEIERLKIRKIALIDDVVTTGATLESAREALLERCMVDVQRWSVARTMPTKTISPT